MFPVCHEPVLGGVKCFPVNISSFSKLSVCSPVISMVDLDHV